MPSPPPPRRRSHRDHLYDDPSPRLEHAEAVIQWQSRAWWLMWVAAFGLALWHSGDSAFEAVALALARHSVDFVSMTNGIART